MQWLKNWSSSIRINQCHRNLWVSSVKFWLCMLLHLVDRPLCLLLSSARFPLTPPHSVQRSQLCSLQSCDLLWHESITARSYLTTGLWWAHHLPTVSHRLKGKSHWDRSHCEGEASALLAPCSPSRSEYQVRLFLVSDTTVIKLLNKQ